MMAYLNNRSYTRERAFKSLKSFGSYRGIEVEDKGWMRGTFGGVVVFDHPVHSYNDYQRALGAMDGATRMRKAMDGPGRTAPRQNGGN